MVVLQPYGLEEEITRIAVTNSVTAYDASYLALAKKHNLTLVTEDQKLAKVSAKIIRTVSLNEIK